MKPIYIILKFIAVLGAAFALSFLLDLAFIKENWLRYALVCILVFSLLLIGLKFIFIEIKKLNN